MNAILGFTDVLLDDDLGLQQRRHLDTVRSAGASLLRLLNEVLDTAKLDKGAVELELDDFDLLALIDELSSTMGANARAKGLQVDIDYDPALPTCLHGDELRIRQVLTNLLDNAIKFTARGGVRLVAEAQGGQLHLLVTDTGIGIAPDRLVAIFEPITQADASMTRRYGGTGLGTTISKQIVELMGGRIWVDSAPGEGASFHVLLPLVPARFAPQKARAQRAGAAAAARAAGRRRRPEHRTARAAAAPARPQHRQRRRRRGGGGAGGGRRLRRHPDGRAHAQTRRLGRYPRHPRRRAGGRAGAHPGGGDDGQRARSAPPRQPRGRHGRLRLEAGRLAGAVA
jgi:hypothetical protein